MGTNRAEELANEYAKQFDFAEDSSPYLDFIEGFNASNKLRQSEIDELTKEKSLFIEKYTKSCNEVQKLEKVNDELTKDKELLDLKLNALDKLFKEQTKEVERLRKGIDWTRAEYIKCVNDSDEITEKLEELLTTH